MRCKGRANTGLVFQSYALWPHMTVEQNVAFGLDVRKVDKDEKTRRAREALAAVQMEQYAERKPTQLSGGEQQRVALARAFIHRPQILFADEPTGNLDDGTGARIEDLLFDLNRERGTALVVVTHDLRLADRCEQVIRLRSGRVEGVGAMEGLGVN